MCSHALPHADEVRNVLEHLREADQLLYSAPRTETRDRIEAAPGDVPIGIFLPGGDALHGTVDFGSEGAGAPREYAAALTCLRAAVARLGAHPDAQQLADFVAQAERTPIARGAPELAYRVRWLFSKLQSDFGLTSVAPLTVWQHLDEDDIAALEAANVRASTKTWVQVALAFWAVVAAVAFLVLA
jgi:hypothetical protein